MSANALITTFDPQASPSKRRRGEADRDAWLGDVVAELTACFGVECSLLDGRTGEVLHAAGSSSSADWETRGALCQEVARRGSVEVIEEDDPLVVLAAPLEGPDGTSIVAVGVFAVAAARDDAAARRAATLLGAGLDDARAWLAEQTPTPVTALVRLAELVQSKFASARQIERLEHENHELSGSLSANYEEISLLYRLSQNLQISRSDDELGRLALQWLGDAMPVEGLAIQLAENPNMVASSPDGRAEPLLLTWGECPVNGELFALLVEQFDVEDLRRATVVNRSVTSQPNWDFPEIREMIVIPLVEGERRFGWLAAFNHVDGRELGTVEASLLGTVAAILAIHASNGDLYRQQDAFLAGVVRALTSAIDAKDRYTCGHSDRVARVAVRLARQLGYEPEMLKEIYLSGLLHDIGKIGIDETVLRKPGKLTDEEFEHIKQHPEIGYRILVDLKKMAHVLPVVLHHHEAWDGRGYPYGLAAEEIPRLARIVGVADAFDAMASDRPYRPGMPEEKLDGILRAGAGKQFDPEVIEAFFQARDDIREIFHRQPDSSDDELHLWTQGR